VSAIGYWLSAIGLVAACAPAPIPPPAPPQPRSAATPPPAPVAAPVRDPWAAKIVVTGDGPMHLVGAASDDAVRDAAELRAALDKLEPTLLPAASTCADSKGAMRKIAVAAEAPHTGDLAIIVGEHDPVARVVEAVRAVQRPAALVVRGDSGERVLPLRLCPDAGTPVLVIPRTVEVSAPADLPMFFVTSSGGTPEAALAPHPWGDGVAPLVHAIAAYGTGSKARVWMSGGMPAESLVLALNAIAASHAQLLELVDATYEPQVLVPAIGEATPADARAELAKHLDALDECYERALFADPSLSSAKLQLAIRGGHASLTGAEPKLDDGANTCFARAVQALAFPRARDEAVTFVLAGARIGSHAAALRHQHPPRRP